jgi:4a-hydroxytetrahydrobiopterin dehydratase
MPTMEAMSEPEIREALKPLPEWKHEDNAIVRTTTFVSFLRVIEFINAVAHLAERQNHHPDIDIRYHRVIIRYWTHRAKGVTHLDFEGAKEVEQLISQFKKL